MSRARWRSAGRSVATGTPSTPATSLTSVDAVEAHDGIVVRTEGDAVFAVFPEAGVAVVGSDRRSTGARRRPRAARRAHSRPDGSAHRRGPPRRRRLRRDSMSAARHASRPSATAARSSCPGRREALVASSLPPDVALRDLGRHVLKDLPAPEHLFQVDVPGLPHGLPADPRRRSRSTATCPTG